MYFTYVVRPGEAPEGRGPKLEPFWNFLVVFNLRIGMILQCLGFIGLLCCIFINEIVAITHHAHETSKLMLDKQIDTKEALKNATNISKLDIKNSNIPYFATKSGETTRNSYNNETHFGHDQGVPYIMLLSFLRAHPDSVGNAPIFLAQLCCCLFVIGSLMNMAFQTLMEDDSSIKQSRGYRAGTKLLQQASSINVFAWSLTFLSLWAATNYFDDAWMQKRLAAGSSWLLFFTGRLVDALGLLIYAAAIFFLETYHSEGVGEFWGWLIGASFSLTAILEVISLTLFGTPLFEIVDTVYTIMFGASLVLTFLWSLAFEPLSHRYDVKLTQSALRNEYYKSRNAMAYYGPAVVNADGEIDISAAAEQAQQCLRC